MGLAVVPVLILVIWIDSLLSESNTLFFIWSAIVLYLCVGWTSLLQHARDVSSALLAGDLDRAREMVSRIVSRDTESLDETEFREVQSSRFLKTVLMLFRRYLLVLYFGVPGVVLYRLVNTLDAMWGYKNTRYRDFGWCAAVVDDVFKLCTRTFNRIKLRLAW